MIVYRATSPSGGIYIGATKFPLYERKSRHYYDAKKGSKSPFQCSIRKYGKENIKWEILHEVETWEQAANLEREEIAKAKKAGHCYNCLDGGDGLVGMKHSEEWKEWMSDLMTGRKLSEEHKERISKAHIGRIRGPMSEEHKKKIGESCKGNTHTEESRLKMSKNIKKHYKENPKTVFDVFTLEGVFIVRCYAYKEFIERFGGSNSGVEAALKKKWRKYKGYNLRQVSHYKDAPTTTTTSTI